MNTQTFEIEETNAYRGGEEIEFDGIHFIVIDNDGDIELLVDEREYAEHENEFDWTVRTLMENTDFLHDDAYGNPGDTFEITLTPADVEKAKALISEFASYEE